MFTTFMSERKGSWVIMMTRGFASKIMRPLTIGTRCVCDDNSGAKLVEIIGVVGVKGKKRRYPVCGVGDIAIVAVKK